MITDVQQRLATTYKTFGYVTRTIGLVWASAGRWTIVWGVLLLIQGLLPAAVVLLTKWVVDAIAAAIGAGATWETAWPVIVPAVLMALAMLAQRVLGSVQEWVSTAQSELVVDHIKGLIHDRATHADFAFYESHDYHDLLEQVNTQAGGRTLQLLNNVGTILQYTVTFVSIAAILVSYSLWLPLVLVAATAPALMVLIRHNRIYHEWWKEATPRRRLTQYYDIMMTSDQPASEVRLFGIGPTFYRGYQQLRKGLRTERLDLLRRQVIARFGAATLALIATGGVLIWISLRAMRGLATLGDIALFYQAFNQGQSIVGGLLQSAGQIYTNTLFLAHLFQFLELPNEVKDPADPVELPRPLRDGIRFEDVRFVYPGTERPALDGFSLHIPPGQITAIVGHNGAGKSTMVKLLCRFYDVTGGRLLVEGIPIQNLGVAALRRRISVMFQFPMKYQMTAADNIRLGDIQNEHSLADVAAAAREAGADTFLERMPDRYDSMLGRWFATGTELSGGEWQRVALARAFLRQADLVILDEPTSFMDSWAETEWMQRFRRMISGRTALLITHRFTTAMQADVIHVMDDGRIIESGTHEELVALGGMYAASWRAQTAARDLGEGAVGDGIGFVGAE